MIQLHREQYSKEELEILKNIFIEGAESYCCGEYRPEYCTGCFKINVCRDLIRMIKFLETAEPIKKQRVYKKRR